MEFGSAFPAHGEVYELAERGEDVLGYVAESAQALDVRGAPTGDDGQEPAIAQLLVRGVGVVAAVTGHRIGAAGWLCLLPGFRRSTGDRPVAARPPFCADVGVVRTRPEPVEFTGRIQLGEQNTVQPVEALPACCHRSKLRRQV